MPSPWARALLDERPVARPSVAALMKRESERAIKAGHALEPWSRDERTSAVTFCTRCSLALAVDSRPESGEPAVYGSVASTTCTGVEFSAPTWAPAVPAMVAA